MAENSIEQKTIAGMPVKIWAVLIFEYIFFAVILFSTAGTLNWLAGWLFIGLFACSVTPMSIRMAKTDPALLEERTKFFPTENQPLWDRILIIALIILILCWLTVPGLDAVRFGWSAMPFWLQMAGGVIMVISLYAIYIVMGQNTYLAPTVRTQQDRGHRVISTGAYSIVRHPFYAVLILFFPAVGLLLGSWWSVFISGLIMLLIAYRLVREETYLKHELDGYADYMDKVRCRLIPYIW